MRLFLTFLSVVPLIVLSMDGCAVKIVPGHVVKQPVQKEAPDKHKVPKAFTSEPKDVQEETINAREFEAEQNLTEMPSEAAMVEGEKSVEKAEEEELQKPRFPKSKQIASIPYRVTMKTKKFAFSDTGFLNIYDNLINLQVFTMGKPTLDLVVRLNEDEICVGSLCNTKHGFNQTFLSGAYPDTLVENVLQRRPILGGKNLKKTSNGFLQKIETKAYLIKYKIWPGNIYFKDAKNGIIMILRRLPK